MNFKIKHINGYILAGGKSSRMGADKGLLLIEGKQMIQYVIEQMQAIFENLVIVSNNPEYEKFGLEVIPDRIKNIGPAGGIYTALSHSSTKLNFIVSCDMPFITKEAIDFMVRNSIESQIILLENQEKLEPLFGIYAKDCEAVWLKLIQQNTIKLQEMVSHFNLKIFPVENNEIFKGTFFKNINTKEDFENISNLNMEIQLLAFGQIADIIGKSAWKMYGIKDSNELIKNLEKQFPALVKMKYSVAVNKKIIQDNAVFSENDTIALLPPFSGG
jgi:molybdopterin-guanine dinucleotide biosynthesis protein A